MKPWRTADTCIPMWASTAVSGFAVAMYPRLMMPLPTKGSLMPLSQYSLKPR